MTELFEGGPAAEPDATPPPPEPAPPPSAGADGNGAQIAPSEPAGPTGRLRIPDDTKGHYVVLFARKPKRGENARPNYAEVACVKAHSPDAAKRLVMTNDDYAELGAFLKHSAAQKPGILLRAVPAMHWPQDVEATTYDRPDPVLTIR